MQLINRKSPEIKANTKRSEERCFILVDSVQNKVSFTVPACAMIGADSGLFVQFMNDGAEWLFYVDDNADGFPFYAARNSFFIANAGLVRLMLKSTGFIGKKRFKIVRTEQMHDKCPLFLLTTKGVTGATR